MAKSALRSAALRHGDSFQAENFLLSACALSLSRHNATVESSTAHPEQKRVFISLDEVGRGCVAGPVVVCATVWETQPTATTFNEWLSALRDSKKMTLASREKVVDFALKQNFLSHGPDWLPPSVHGGPTLLGAKMRGSRNELLYLPRHQFKWSAEDLSEALRQNPSREHSQPQYMLKAAFIGAATADEIDERGIIQALGLAASRALRLTDLKVQPSAVFFDGPRPIALVSPWAGVPQILVTKGDDLLKSVSTSSVVAKVVRDRWMEHYATQYQSYFLEENRGYGTEKHINSLKKQGLSPLHRRSFLKNICPPHNC